MSNRKPVSPPNSTEVDGSYKCYVDCEGQLWEAFWTGSHNYPDLSSLSLHRVVLSNHMTTTWHDTQQLDFGSSAVIRAFDHGTFPVVKLAHPNNEARQQIQHEYGILRNLAGSTVIPKIDPNPLEDEDGVYGFRLERLRKIDLEDIGAQSNEIRDVARQLHRLGYCHGDLSPSNVMKNDRGQIVLIDFAFAGEIGRNVPTYIPEWVYREGVFDVNSDEDRLKRFFNAD